MLLIAADDYFFSFFLLSQVSAKTGQRRLLSLSVSDSCKTQMPSSGSQALTPSLASCLVFWLAPLPVAVAAAELSLQPIDAKLAHSDSASLLAVPLLLDLALQEISV